MIRLLGPAAIVFFSVICELSAQTLRIATVNAWSGLDYIGMVSMGEYESPAAREKRTSLLIDELRSLHPDVVALQEVNPVSSLAERIADALDYDYVARRINAGVKFGPLGFPVNFNEGMAVLARRQLHLAFSDVWVLPGGFGAFAGALSFHFTERNAALVSTVRIGDRVLHIIVTHLNAAVPLSDGGRAEAGRIADQAGFDAAGRTALIAEYERAASIRENQTAVIREKLQSRIHTLPAVILGDFNATPDSPEMVTLTRDGGIIDVRAVDPRPTWDPERNTNIRFSRDTVDASGTPLSAFDKISSWWDGMPRRIDYILLNKAFGSDDVRGGGRFLDTPRDGLFASDHFGVWADVSVTNAMAVYGVAEDSIPEILTPSIGGTPFPAYDTDIGFGLGAKGVLMNQFGMKERVDITAFASTKGERWVQLLVSIPDNDLRQRKVYSWSADLKVDYDKYISNSFFGIGNASKFSDRESYTREPLEIRLTAGRGFSTRFVAEAGMRLVTVRNFRIAPASRLRARGLALDTGRATTLGGVIAVRYDSRDQFRDPSRGLSAELECEFDPASAVGTNALIRTATWIKWYATLFYPRTVLAFRAGLQTVNGKNIPLQFLLPVGGNRTLRGSPQDRYLDRVSSVCNIELRFPIWWRFTGVAGFDAGKVWSDVERIDLRNWPSNPVAGLRFNADEWIARLDVGLGRETTGVYLNFEHLF